MIKIGVLMGGPSEECEVSFNSGRTICDYIDKYKYEVIPLFLNRLNKIFILPWQFLYRGKISDFEKRLSEEALSIELIDLSHIVDFVFLALHGTCGEDGTIQGMLKMLNIAHSGSSITFNAITMNKYIVGKLLAQQGIIVPKSIKIKKNLYSHFNEIQDFLTKKKKIIIKPVSEGSSIGVICIQSEADLNAFFETKDPFYQSNKSEFLIQEYINGREFTIIAFQNKEKWHYFKSTEIIKNSAVFGYRDKYLPGSTLKITPAPFSENISQTIQTIVESIINTFNPNDLIRVDGIVSTENDKVYIIDINSFPGTAPSSFVFVQGAYANIDPVTIIDTIIENGLERHTKKNYLQKKPLLKKKIEKIKVAILFGGKSSEREISLESGRNVYYKLSRQWFECDLIFVSSQFEYFTLELPQIVKDTTNEIENSLKKSQKKTLLDLKKTYNFFFIALHGGEGENGVLQKELEENEMLFNGSSSFVSSICMSKSLTLNILEKKEISTTNRVIIFAHDKDFENQKKLITDLLQKNKKIFIKPNQDGCSNNVFSTDSINEVFHYLDLIFKSGQTECLIEEALIGTELTIGIIGNQDNFTVLPITQTVKGKDFLTLEEKFLPGAGENITPALLLPEETKIAQKIIRDTYAAIGCDGYSRVDCFWIPTKNSITILEINSLPALTPATCIFHQAAELKIHPAEFLQYIIYLSYKKNNKLSSLPTDFLISIEETKKKLITYQPN